MTDYTLTKPTTMNNLEFVDYLSGNEALGIEDIVITSDNIIIRMYSAKASKIAKIVIKKDTGRNVMIHGRNLLFSRKSILDKFNNDDNACEFLSLESPRRD